MCKRKTNKRKKATGILCLHKDEVFLAKRSEHKRAPGIWHCPGGKLEGEENYLEAALREFQEEVGLNLSDKKLIKTSDSYTKNYKYRLFIVNCPKKFSVVSTLDNKENSEFEWFKLSEIPYKTHTKLKPILKVLRYFF